MRKGIEETGAGAPQRGEMFGLPVEAPEVQAALALASYRAAHHDRSIDPADWEHNTVSVQAAAMSEWVGNPHDLHSLAAQYRAYVEQHPHELIDMSDEAALEALLVSLQPPQAH